jgi:hypothetical protein
MPDPIMMVTDEKTKVDVSPGNRCYMFFPDKPVEVLPQHISACRKAGVYPANGKEITVGAEVKAEVTLAKAKAAPPVSLLTEDQVVMLHTAVEEILRSNDPTLLNENGLPKIGAVRGLVDFDVTVNDLKDTVVQIHGDSE